MYIKEKNWYEYWTMVLIYVRNILLLMEAPKRICPLFAQLKSILRVLCHTHHKIYYATVSYTWDLTKNERNQILFMFKTPEEINITIQLWIKTIKVDIYDTNILLPKHYKDLVSFLTWPDLKCLAISHAILKSDLWEML